jgi:hypothetical protein
LFVRGVDILLFGELGLDAVLFLDEHTLHVDSHERGRLHLDHFVFSDGLS